MSFRQVFDSFGDLMLINCPEYFEAASFLVLVSHFVARTVHLLLPLFRPAEEFNTDLVCRRTFVGGGADHGLQI